MRDQPPSDSEAPGGPGPAPMSAQESRHRTEPPAEAADELLGRLMAQRPAGEAGQLVGCLSDARRLLQDYRPFAQSLEWEIGAQHWRTAGVRPFVRNEVPFLINNDGRLSALAAALLVANCADSGPSGPIAVIEYGAGSGLFARFLLESLRGAGCDGGADVYERLVFFVTDASPRTVADWEERGLFAEHGTHVVLAVCAAEKPGELRTLDGRAVELPPLRAAFCNYVLDVLPSALVRRQPAGWEELCVRTMLTGDAARIRERTASSPEEIAALAGGADAAARAGVEALLPLFEYDVAYRPVTRPIPYLEEAAACAGDTGRILLNHGACGLLEAVAARLDDRGFLLVNDYGATDAGGQAAHGVCQRFGVTSALGLNFPLLERFAVGRGLRFLAPPGDSARAIHTRLVAREALPSTERVFLERFAAAAIDALDEPMQRARTAIAAGSFGEALDRCRDALLLQPRNWWMLGEIAEFVLFRIQDAGAALELARRAIELNPNLSAWLWNILGDALWTLERQREAHVAYLRSQRIDPDDPRTLLNLGYSFLWQAEHAAALEAIGRGLACDRGGLYRDRLLAKQHEILTAVATADQRDREHTVARLARFQAVALGNDPGAKAT